MESVSNELKENPMVRTIRLKPKVDKLIHQLATEENRNFSNMIETILLKHLKELKKLE